MIYKSSLVLLAVISLIVIALVPNRNQQGELLESDIVLEDLPESVISTMEARDSWFKEASTPNIGESYVVDDILKWKAGGTVRVAFLGGDAVLHKEIESATKQITNTCNIKFDFGFNSTTGKYRSWSTNDATYTAEIRVSFDYKGYFSLVGTDCVSPNIGNPNDGIGGRPYQRTLNLGGFHIYKPPKWKGTVRHEFLHAVGFHHEHQSHVGDCENEFRWDDDPGYQPTQDRQGRYITDAIGKRPGIYTYLSGYPNFWKTPQVDHNLRQLEPINITASSFDRYSVMLYRFDNLFYIKMPSPCAPLGNGEDLSDGDKAGLLALYPRDVSMATEATQRQFEAFESLLESENLNPQIKAGLQTQRNILESLGTQHKK